MKSRHQQKEIFSQVSKEWGLSWGSLQAGYCPKVYERKVFTPSEKLLAGTAGYSYPVTTSEYTTYTAPAASAAPTTGSDWLPLGVFAVANNAAGTANSNRFIQLAVNRQGEIDGVYYNASTDKAQDLVGIVDQKTQRASWSLTNRPDSPIASTGIYNLTEDQTPINVHFSDGTDQTWTLVRIQQ